ncbi:YchJ family protein [Utexia brackfieldae]|uniref:YchJ family protein n=1 Tax=Utexia brackfieldae TaxID=3074108 RepID=UPI00370D51B3
MTKSIQKNTDCPCGIQQSYAQCCQPYHLWQKNAPDAETLMRSRYSAYALKNAKYLIATWHPKTLPNQLAEYLNEAKWIELKIEKSWPGDKADEAYVEFTARYRNSSGRAEKMHEISRFIKQGDHWFYVDGQVS